MSKKNKLNTASHHFLEVFNKENKNLPNDYRNVRHIGFLSDYFNYLLAISSLNPSRVLDWGAGNGHISYLLNHGLDISTDSFIVNPNIKTLDFLKKLNLNLITSSDKFDLPFDNEAYDIVISSGVLEHVNEYGGDLNHSLNEIIRVLKPGGYLIIWRLPFAFSIWEYFRYTLNHWYHPERYTPLQVNDLARKYRLEVVELSLDGLFFVSFRCFLRKFRVTNFIVEHLENLLNKLPLLHFLLNDIFCILKKNK